MAPLTARPRTKDFALSRSLRVFVFSFVVAVLLVGLTINLIAYAWDNWARHLDFIDGQPYDAKPLFVAPTIVIVALIFSKILWDFAKVPAEQRVRDSTEGPHMEPTTHADPDHKRRFDPSPSAKDRATRSGPTGPSGYGGPSGGWDQPKLP